VIYSGNVFVGYKDPTQNQIDTLTENIVNRPVMNAVQVDASSRTNRLRGCSAPA